MSADNKQWASIRESFVYWANKRKANSVPPYASIREAVRFLADNDNTSYEVGGGGDGFFEPIYDEDTGNIVAIKSLYDIKIIQETVNDEEVLKNISALLRHLRLETVSIPSTEPPVPGEEPPPPTEVTFLVSDLSIVSEGNVIAGGIGGESNPGNVLPIDIVITGAPEDGQLLVYNINTGQWENSYTKIANLLDVDVTNLGNNDVLTYNALLGKWVPTQFVGGTVPEESVFFTALEDQNQDIVGAEAIFDLYIKLQGGQNRNISEMLRHLRIETLNGVEFLVSDISFASELNVIAGGFASGGGGSVPVENTLLDLVDTDINNPTNGDVLIYNGTLWANGKLYLDDLLDVNVTGVAAEQVLVYDAATGKWVARDANFGVEDPFFESYVVGGVDLGAKALVDLYIDDGASNIKNITSILRHLRLESVDGHSFLVSDISFCSEYAVIAGGISPAPGGASGSASSLGELEDVDILAPVSGGSILIYNHETSLWENKPLLLGDISNVSTSNLRDGDVLVYNSSSGLWVSSRAHFGVSGITMSEEFVVTAGTGVNEGVIDIAIHEDYVMMLLTERNILSHFSIQQDAHGASVVVCDLSLASNLNVIAGGVGGDGGSSSLLLDNLSDVTISGPTNNQVLTFVDGVWVNANSTGGSYSLSADTDNFIIHLLQAEGVIASSISGADIASVIGNNKVARSTLADTAIFAQDCWVYLRVGGYNAVGSAVNPYCTIGTGIGTARGFFRLIGTNGITISSDSNHNITIMGAGSGGSGGGNYTLPPATTSSLGGVIVGSGLSVTGAGVLSTNIPYASPSVAGLIKVGSGLTINSSGVLSASGISYTQGVGISIVNSTISLAGGVVSPGSYKSVTVDTYGRVISGLNPTTLSGYGITDTYISGDTITIGGSSITPISSISVTDHNPTIGSSATTIATIQGVAIRAKIDNYLLASSFTATNIKNTLGTTAVNRAIADDQGNVISSTYMLAGNAFTQAMADARYLKLTGGTLSGSLTIGSNGQSLSLMVYGNISASGNVTAGQASDQRLKRDIKELPLDKALSILDSIIPVNFEWNDLATELGGLRGRSYGFIAKNYLENIPYAGRKIWEKYDAIDYNQIIPVLLRGYQYLYKKLINLEKEQQNTQ